MRGLLRRGLPMVICGLSLFGATSLWADECPGNPDALGTSRTIVVDPSEHPRLGAMQYHESLPLEDHEVVITFDDGPLPPRSTRVLEILAHECVKATYFMVGRMARSFPDTVRHTRDAGHTIGTHSYSHPFTFHKMSIEKAQSEINDGIAAVASALGDGTEPAPFFRIPGLLRADGVERYLASRQIQVWSADFPADDWLKIEPTQVYARALQRIEANHKGILLLHDIQTRTVEALPNLLRELKRRGYRVVHVVSATADLPRTATDSSQWTKHARPRWPAAPIIIETEAELLVPSPASFGVDASFDSRSVIHAPVHRPHASFPPRGQTPAPQVSTPRVSAWPRGLGGLPEVPALPDRPQLPAPSSQSLGYLGNAPPPWIEISASADAAPETTGVGNDIRHLLDSLPPEDSPTGSIPPLPPQPRGPISTASMPRGAYP